MVIFDKMSYSVFLRIYVFAIRLPPHFSVILNSVLKLSFLFFNFNPPYHCLNSSLMEDAYSYSFSRNIVM